MSDREKLELWGNVGRSFWWLPVVAALAVAGCLDWHGPSAPSEPSSVSVDVEVNQTVFPPPTPPPPAPPSDEDALCPPARGLEVSGFGGPIPATLQVGQAVRLDATPLDAQGQPRTAECDQLRGIAWLATGPCSLDDPASFTPVVTAEGAGSCQVAAQVEDVEDSVTLVIQ